jgi:membrane-bound serine protease (ClpP class)
MIWWALVLFGGGMFLVLAEFIVPGGVCGLTGALMIGASTVIGCMHYPDYALWIVSGEVLGAMLSVVLGMVVLSRTRAGKTITLEDSQKGWVASESDMSLLEAEGEVFTALRPVGTIIVDGQRVTAVADGSFIEKGERVRVIEVHGNRIVVESASS